MPETRDEEIRRIVENRRRNAEIRREELMRKRNITITGIIGVVLLIILIIVISVSCSSKKSRGEKETTVAITTNEAAVTTVQDTTSTDETTATDETTRALDETTSSGDDNPSDNSSDSVMYTNEGINLRSEPNSDSSDNIISTIEKGEKVTIIGVEDEWTKVKYDGNTGYVSSQYLSRTNVYDE